MKVNRIVLLLNAIALSLFVAGCGPQVADEQVQKQKAVPAGLHNPGADIHLLTRQVAAQTAGDTLLFDLRLRVGHPQGLLTIRLGSSEGLRVLGEQQFQIDLDRKQDIVLPIDIYAVANGRHYLPINAVVDLPNGQRFHRAFSVIVQVGGRKALGKQEKSVSEPPMVNQEGQVINILPATEEIK